MRGDGRRADEMRPLAFEVDFTDQPLGSVLCSMGRTRVLCTVCEEPDVPRWMRGGGEGWVTAEYSMLPGATNTRNEREASRGKLSGRTMEIQRLIGRSLRAVVDRKALGERTLYVDCDVLQADGGTRTASISGALSPSPSRSDASSAEACWRGVCCATSSRRSPSGSSTAWGCSICLMRRIPGPRST